MNRPFFNNPFLQNPNILVPTPSSNQNDPVINKSLPFEIRPDLSLPIINKRPDGSIYFPPSRPVEPGNAFPSPGIPTPIPVIKEEPSMLTNILNFVLLTSPAWATYLIFRK